jgi:archaellum component FlaC
VIAKVDDIANGIRRLKAKIGLEKQVELLFNEAKKVTRDIKTKSKSIIDGAVEQFIIELRAIVKQAINQVLKALQTDIGK